MKNDNEIDINDNYDNNNNEKIYNIDNDNKLKLLWL